MIDKLAAYLDAYEIHIVEVPGGWLVKNEGAIQFNPMPEVIHADYGDALLRAIDIVIGINATVMRNYYDSKIAELSESKDNTTE